MKETQVNILITGMNSLQCIEDYYKRQQLEVVATHYALVKALRDMGHTVDQRPVDIGESLDEYDEVIVFIHSPSGFAGYVYNALWAIHRRPNCILSIDDWQADSIYTGSSSLNTETLFRKFIKESHVNIPDDIEKYTSQLLEAVDIIANKKNRLMIAGFNGGDISLMLPAYPKELLMTWSLNPYHLNRRPENNFTGDDDVVSFGSSLISPEEKKREWTFASLVQARTRKWLKGLNMSGEWPINYYGAKGGEYKSERVKEPKMCEIYQRNWGCLAPKYYHAGSGFWRPRAFQVADANSILVVDDAEGAVYSEAHVGVNPAEIEQMDLSQLIELAKRQKEGLYDNHPLDKSITSANLTAILESK